MQWEWKAAMMTMRNSRRRRSSSRRHNQEVAGAAAGEVLLWRREDAMKPRYLGGGAAQGVNGMQLPNQPFANILIPSLLATVVHSPAVAHSDCPNFCLGHWVHRVELNWKMAQCHIFMQTWGTMPLGGGVISMKPPCPSAIWWNIEPPQIWQWWTPHSGWFILH